MSLFDRVAVHYVSGGADQTRSALTEAKVNAPMPRAIEQALDAGQVHRFAEPLSAVYTGNARKITMRVLKSGTRSAKAWNTFREAFASEAAQEIMALLHEKGV